MCDGGVAGEAHDEAVRARVGERLERADVRCRGRVDRHGELLVELADQRLEVALTRLALAAGQVEALAAGVAGHEQAPLLQVDPRDLVDEVSHPTNVTVRARRRLTAYLMRASGRTHAPERITLPGVCIPV